VRLADRTNQQFASGCPENLAEELGSDGIRTLLEIICKAYKNLLVFEKVTSVMNETRITEELFIELQNVMIMSTNEYTFSPNLYPVHEKSHDRKGKGRGKTPTIDFCFRDRWVRDRYFGAECKLLKENHKTLYDDYVAGGVCRYLAGKYSENCSTGSMIGYITSGNIREIISEVKNRVDKEHNVSKMENRIPLIVSMNITSLYIIKQKLIFFIYIIYFFLSHKSHIKNNNINKGS
jgi:hypothetical protein